MGNYTMNKISEDEIIRSNLSVVDDIGTVYVGKEYIYRVINSDYVEDVKKILESGLIQELVSKNIFPKTEISEQKIKGNNLVLRHEKISRVIYPFEWSPEMLRKAALCVLQVNECANKYGYELKDAHPYNVLFKFNQPVFVDFGSIVKCKVQGHWIAKKEFLDCYFNNLKLVQNGFLSLYKTAFHRKGTGYTDIEILRINNKFYSFLGGRISKKINILLHYYQYGVFVSNASIEKKFKNAFFRNLIKFLFKSRFLPFRNASIESLRLKINKINISHSSSWKEYHKINNYLTEEGKILLPSRMEWIVDKIRALPIKTVTELAGNEGVLSRYISTLPNIKEVICTDYDENAIDSLLLNSDDEKIYMGCFDFVDEIHEQISPDRSNRLKSDLVIALAVTHHLVLTQKITMDYIFTTVSSFTKKYIIIEFMPLGLWDGKFSPELPSWYTEEWFVEHMEKFYRIMHREQLEENRIVFIGELLNQGGIHA